MVQLQSSLKDITAAGVQLVGISYDSVEILQRFAARRGIMFRLLSDPGSKTIDAYGIRNREATGKAGGIPYPGTFVVDRAGVIRAKLFREGYKERHEVEELIAAAKALKDR